MIRLFVASDSHGEYSALQAFARIAKREKAHAVCHLGDFASDAEMLREMLGGIPLYSVRGNCDSQGAAPKERVEHFGACSVLLCHGHAYSVKSGTRELAEAAAEMGAHLALFGHTHTSLERYQNGVFLINPGALCGGRFAIVEIDEDGTPFASFEDVR
ncbi:MAG: metallophosphoesterase family protein [Christensenellales bacterium]|jgi:putative phosphoesterase